ncbi:HAD-IIB family hydrolase [Bifidobacterium scaligerum]|uniref:phosphomannomutase n=1 Tax=Bifidobacterium scaligerum TaxID=2052656 RepID=A0A2M9HQQ8_9BIFI|nr:HAD-IIB family hydrolase [Bifidobacterium scaligerum]PJM79147.1 HAD family hydrolase [Bifidobacterium scaligerum]
MMVHHWTELDLDNVCARVKVFGFDLDNTLASSKRPMAPEMTQRFISLLDRIPIALISGGSMEVVTSQVLDQLGDEARREQLHVMPTSGSRYYQWNGSQWSLIYAHDLDAETVRVVRSSLEKHARALGLWEEQVWGPRIENRGSQITFSALGQYAPVEVKRTWDIDNTKKQALVRAVSSDLPDLRVRAGGYSSVDVSMYGLDKAYAVRRLAQMLSIETNEIAFVGDRMSADGNDYPAVAAGAAGIMVREPQDTLALMDALLACLDTFGVER